MQCNAMQCNAMQYSSVQFNAIACLQSAGAVVQINQKPYTIVNL